MKAYNVELTCEDCGWREEDYTVEAENDFSAFRKAREVAQDDDWCVHSIKKEGDKLIVTGMCESCCRAHL